MIIDKSVKKKCRECEGIGAIGHYLDFRGECQEINCKSCDGTGIYKEEYGIIIINKIAIDTDSLGK